MLMPLKNFVNSSIRFTKLHMSQNKLSPNTYSFEVSKPLKMIDSANYKLQTNKTLMTYVFQIYNEYE